MVQQQGGGMTPSGQGGNQMNAQSKQMMQQPQFPGFSNSNNVTMKLESILDTFFNSMRDPRSDSMDPVWPEARGPAYREVLGAPSGAAPLPPVSNMNQQMQGGGGGWQPQQQPQQQP